MEVAYVSSFTAGDARVSRMRYDIVCVETLMRPRPWRWNNVSMRCVIPVTHSWRLPVREPLENRIHGYEDPNLCPA